MKLYTRAIIGNPQEVIEKVLYIKEAIKVDQILWQIDFGGQPYEKSIRTLNLFAEQVLPYVR